MTLVHIHRADVQPATRWQLDLGEGRDPLVITNAPDRPLQCSACYRIRPAAKMVAHVYYDETNYYCREEEYGRSREFPFEYRKVCKGAAWKPPSKEPGA